MKKYIISLVIASIFLIGTHFAVNQASAADLSIRDFINLLVAIGVITPDKMPTVNAFLATLNNPTPVTPSLPTPVVSPINNKLPVIKSISDNSGVSGDTITIYGENLKNPNGDTLVQFLYQGIDAGGVYSSSVKSDGTQIKFKLDGIVIANSAPVDQLRISYGSAFPNATKSNVINFNIGSIDNIQQPTPVTQSSVTVLSPNGGEKYTTNSIINIKWSGPSGYYNILLTDKDGFGRGTIASSVYKDINNSSGYQWNVHNLSMTSDRGDVYMDTVPGNYKILIVSQKVDNVVGYSISDSSDNYFRIVSDVATPVVQPVVSEPSIPNIIITDISADELGVYVSYINNGSLSSDKFLIAVSSQYGSFPGNSIYPISVPTPGVLTKTGCFGSGLLGLGAGATANVTASVVWQNPTGGQTNNTFSKTVTIPGGGQSLSPVASCDSTGSLCITVTSPTGGETLTIGQTYRIKWTSTPNVGKVSLGYSTGPGSLNWIANNIDNTGYYDWSVNPRTLTKLRIEIDGYGAGSMVTAYSSDYFNLTQ